MNRVALDLGFIQIYWYSICIFFGVLFASIVILRECKRQKVNEEFMSNLIFYTVIIGLIGARAYYCLFNLDYYLQYPLEILEIWNGGLAIHGGLIAGLAFVFFYCRKYKVKLFKITDIASPGLILAQAIGRWGNFFNQEAFGQEVAKSSLEFLPDFIVEGMNINGKYYQPTFLYESIWNVVGFIILILMRKYKHLKTGMLTGFYMMWYALGRFIIEAFRSDSLMLGSIKMAQLVSILMFVFGLVIFLFSKKENYNEEDNNYLKTKNESMKF